MRAPILFADYSYLELKLPGVNDVDLYFEFAIQLDYDEFGECRVTWPNDPRLLIPIPANRNAEEIKERVTEIYLQWRAKKDHEWNQERGK